MLKSFWRKKDLKCGSVRILESFESFEIGVLLIRFVTANHDVVSSNTNKNMQKNVYLIPRAPNTLLRI